MKLQSLILRLTVIENKIASIQEQIEVVKNLPYYKNFNKEIEREYDLADLSLQLKDFISIKLGILDNFDSAINLENALFHPLQRKLNLSGYVLEKVN